jgi:uncharacterized protein YtpQ (UPF0354 family)
MIQPSREQFLQQVIELVRDRFPAAKVARAQQPFALRVNGQLASMENVYRSALLQPDQAAGIIERWIVEMIRASEGPPTQHAPYEELAERIMPVVLRDGSVDPETALMVTQSLVSGLSVGYVVDSDRSFWYIPKASFESWHISIDDLHERALSNLVERSQAISAHAAQDPDGKINLILFQTGDGFDASRILLPTLNERLREHLGSPFLAGIPNREILLCFRDDEETVDRLRQQIKTDYKQMPHPITDRLLLVTPDGIAPHD